jgi:hypothetical protein
MKVIQPAAIVEKWLFALGLSMFLCTGLLRAQTPSYTYGVFQNKVSFRLPEQFIRTIRTSGQKHLVLGHYNNTEADLYLADTLWSTHPEMSYSISSHALNPFGIAEQSSGQFHVSALDDQKAMVFTVDGGLGLVSHGAYEHNNIIPAGAPTVALSNYVIATTPTSLKMIHNGNIRNKKANNTDNLTTVGISMVSLATFFNTASAIGSKSYGKQIYGNFNMELKEVLMKDKTLLFIGNNIDNHSGFVICTDTSGSVLLWAAQYTSPNGTHKLSFEKAKLLSSGYLALVGQAEGASSCDQALFMTVDAGTGGITVNSVTKIYEKACGDAATSLEVLDNTGHCCIGIQSNTAQEAILLRIEPNGSIKWANRYGANADDNYFADMAVTQTGKVIVVGQTKTTDNKGWALKVNSMGYSGCEQYGETLVASDIAVSKVSIYSNINIADAGFSGSNIGDATFSLSPAVTATSNSTTNSMCSCASAGITFSNQNLCENALRHLSPTFPSSYYTYKWYVNNVLVSSDPEFDLYNQGLMNIKLVVTSDYCTDEVTSSFQSLGPPVADFNVDQNGLSGTLNSVQQGPYTFQWTITDANGVVSGPYTGSSLPHTFPSDGTYNICLTVLGGCADMEKCKKICVGSALQSPTFSVSPTDICVGNTSTFTSQGASYFQWLVNDIPVDGTVTVQGGFNVSNATYTFTEPGDYIVTLKAYTQCGSKFDLKTSQATVHVRAKPTATISYNYVKYDATNAEITFTATGPAGYNYSWNCPACTPSSGSGQTFTTHIPYGDVDNLGNRYKVDLTVTEDSGPPYTCDPQVVSQTICTSDGVIDCCKCHGNNVPIN